MITKGCRITIEQVVNGFVVMPAAGYRQSDKVGESVSGDTMVFANGRALRKFLSTHYEEQPGGVDKAPTSLLLDLKGIV